MQREIKRRAQLYGVIAIILAVALGTLVYSLRVSPPESQTPSQQFLQTFSSCNELRDFLMSHAEIQGAFPFYSSFDVSPLRGLSAEAAATAQAASATSLKFSTTNIQVAGVDEADIVKTDGEYIYLISGSNVTILKAYPAEEAEVVSKITSEGMYPLGLFVSGDRLVVLGSKYSVPSQGYYRSFVVDIKTYVQVYDISEKSQPMFLTDFTMSGSYFNSRMIDGYVYFVISQPAYVIYDTVILPKIYSNSEIREIDASEIHYSNTPDNYFMFTTVVALNIQDIAEEPTHETIMMGGTSSMYVSLNNIYITFPESDEETSIYRMRIEKSALNIEAHGEVPGRELNQFSMDEYNNHFRVATNRRLNGIAQSNVYVLDMDLTIVGRLEDIAPGENLDSARFIENRSYLSTSVVRRDPFFVIDVENPMDPKILGFLKIPGFTRYLHPYDKDHVIGVGVDGGNVKISLFDVSNVSAPIEIDKYAFEGYWSDTPVLTDHKAFLFERSKNLLAMPVSISYYDYSPTGFGTYMQKQSAYVFDITLTKGLVLKGSITHQAPSASGFDQSYDVKRILYIENVLYTLSDGKIKMNNPEDLTPIKEIAIR